MGEQTKIQWCDHTWNPWRGCTKISKGCSHCYAETLSLRNPRVLGEWGPHGVRAIAAEPYWELPFQWDRTAKRHGERRKVFCLSLGDIWEDHPTLAESRFRVMDTIRRTPNLDWLLLSKRPENWDPLVTNMYTNTYSKDTETSLTKEWLHSWYRGFRPHNVWIGASVEDNYTAFGRLGALLGIPAVVRFLSIEPLLERISPCSLSLYRFAVPKHREHWPAERVKNFWIIIGGESGPRKKARPCDMQWIRELVYECKDKGIPVYVKQLGSNVVDNSYPTIETTDSKGGDISEFPAELQIREFPDPFA